MTTRITIPSSHTWRSAQEQFGAALLDGFTPEELEHMQRSMERIRKNVEKYLEDKNNDNVD